MAHFLILSELGLVFFFCLRPAVDPDYGWHIANGLHVADRATLSGRDIYSWTATNLWIAHEWITEAVMAFVHQIFGATGNSILAAMIGCAAYAIVVLNLRARLVPMSTIVLTIPIAFVGAMRSVGVRPQVLELLYLSALVAGIDAYLGKRLSRRAAIAILAGGAVLWVNTHGSFLLLFAVMAITALELFVARDRRWSDFLVGAGVAIILAVINPWGIRIFGFATQSVLSAPTLAHIDEWKRPRLDEALAVPLLLQVALAIVGIALTLRERKRSHDLDHAPYTVGLIRTAAFAYLAFTSGRHIMLFGIAAATTIAGGIQPFATSLRDALRLDRFQETDSRRELINILAAGLVLFVIARTSWMRVSPEAQRSAIAHRYPVGLLSALRSRMTVSDRLFNEYSWGGFLIQESILPVFIDGRSELYGDDQLKRYASIIHLESGWEERLRALGVTRVLMPRSAPLSAALITRSWIPVASDSVGILLARKGSAP